EEKHREQNEHPGSSPGDGSHKVGSRTHVDHSWACSGAHTSPVRSRRAFLRTALRQTTTGTRHCVSAPHVHREESLTSLRNYVFNGRAACCKGGSKDGLGGARSGQGRGRSKGVDSPNCTGLPMLMAEQKNFRPHPGARPGPF